MNRWIFRSVPVATFILIVCAAPVSVVLAQSASPQDSAIVLKGGEEGTVFKSLTIEGEDRVKIEFERPPLELDLDPYTAPGLDWDSTWEILGRTGIDFVSPLIGQSAYVSSTYLPRPWLDEFDTGDVVRFRPALNEVARWRLDIVDSHSETVASFEGEGNPPKEIGWDGRSLNGEPMSPGLTYSYVLEAYDRAGNKRNFVGKGFELPPYQLETKEGITLVFSGGEVMSLYARGREGSAVPPSILLDAANRINQIRRPDQVIRIEVTARTFEEADNLAQGVHRSIEPLLLGDPSRIQHVTEVVPDAPERGTVAIVVAR
jgi:hypothetical protein